MDTCKITVLEKGLNQHFIDRYVEKERRLTLGRCPVFEEGQEFEADIIKGMPDGFCAWAWNDIYKSLVGLATGGNYNEWYEGNDTIIACCTDGTRPVYFKIERLR